jgi:hypothetical protein
VRSTVRFLVIVSGVAVAASAVGLSVASYVLYFRHVPAVRELVAALPAEEARPPQHYVLTVTRLEPKRFALLPARGLLARFYPAPLSNTRWHVLFFTWYQLLPLSLSHDELLALHAHFLPLEGGQGLVYAARHYYSKVPAQLSAREVLELLAIAQSPSANSPTGNPERFRRAVERLATQLGAPAA